MGGPISFRNATAEEFRAVAGWGPAEAWFGMVAVRDNRVIGLGAVNWMRHALDPYRRLLAWATLDLADKSVPPVPLCKLIVNRLRILGRAGELAVYSHSHPSSDGKLLHRLGFRPCELPSAVPGLELLVLDLSQVRLGVRDRGDMETLACQ